MYIPTSLRGKGVFFVCEKPVSHLLTTYIIQRVRGIRKLKPVLRRRIPERIRRNWFFIESLNFVRFSMIIKYQKQRRREKDVF